MQAPFDAGFNAAVLHIANRLTRGFRVMDDAPSTYTALETYVALHGVIPVWSGASEDTIFGDAEVNYAFRAWHDWCHLKGGFDFTPEGERKACAMQAQHIIELYGLSAQTAHWLNLLFCEVVGQIEYTLAVGDFPIDQRAFTRAYLTAKAEGKAVDWKRFHEQAKFAASLIRLQAA